MRERDYSEPKVRMGRTCWGNPGLRFRQLGEPCVKGDGMVGCKRNEGGRDLTWDAVNWEGMVAGEEGVGGTEWEGGKGGDRVWRGRNGREG